MAAPATVPAESSGGGLDAVEHVPAYVPRDADARLRDWEDARGAAAGRHARGAALVAAAIDLRRAGYTGPIPRVVLGQVQEQYLTGPEHGRTPREPLP